MHLLIDMPSIDKENDEGKLEAHHAFWNYPNNAQLHKTITEFIVKFIGSVSSTLNGNFQSPLK